MDADSIVERLGPSDSVLVDMVSVIRASRPQVIIVLTAANDRDATRRYTARPTAASFAIAGDTARRSTRTTTAIGGRSPARILVNRLCTELAWR